MSVSASQSLLRSIGPSCVGTVPRRVRWRALRGRAKLWPVITFIQPCSPIAAHNIPTGDEWLHEPKLDGYRVQVAKDGRTVRLFSRQGAEWTKRLPSLVDALRAIPTKSAILDGELCMPNAGGIPDFIALHRYGMTHGHELAVFAFDMLHRDGRDLRGLPLMVRRRRLSRLLAKSDAPCLHLVPSFEDGNKLFAAAERLQLEGIVSKRKASPYQSGPTHDWQKIKTPNWREANRERWRLFHKPSR
jgi:bifunctional non-homologous end joining protein LigD